MITEQLISHEELLDAVHEAAVEYVEAERVLQHYRAMNPLSALGHPKMEELKRTVSAKSQVLREAQTQLLLSSPAQ